MKRRRFVRNTAAAGMGLSVLGIYSCKEAKKEEKEDMESDMETAEPFFKLSLAQWSVHRMIRNGELDPYEFASKASYGRFCR